MGHFTNWIANALAIMVAAYVLPGVHVANIWTALIVALVLGILNILVKPILVILTLPITAITFGLFLLVINAVLAVMASHIVPGFTVDSFVWAFIFSLAVSLINMAIARM
ncbi:MAG TPA: phage holin family protein [Candidatus Acidoferrales bacterium]|nr:phage holin family protein [Candidatus Acidoferrales bacterium]